MMFFVLVNVTYFLRTFEYIIDDDNLKFKKWRINYIRNLSLDMNHQFKSTNLWRAIIKKTKAAVRTTLTHLLRFKVIILINLEILDAILPPRDWTDHHNKLHIQYVSHQPSSREDVEELT